MSGLEKIEWESKYSVSIDEIDNHQKTILEMFNALIDMKKSKTDGKDCSNMISDLNEYAKMYFAAEEKYLRKIGYPDLQNHSKAHRRFIRHAINLRREIADDTANLTDEAISVLREWIVEHILTIDRLFVPFVRINQLIDESKRKN